MTEEDFRDVRYEVYGRVEGIECHNMVTCHVDTCVWIKARNTFHHDQLLWTVSAAIARINHEEDL